LLVVMWFLLAAGVGIHPLPRGTGLEPLKTHDGLAVGESTVVLGERRKVSAGGVLIFSVCGALLSGKP